MDPIQTSVSRNPHSFRRSSSFRLVFWWKACILSLLLTRLYFENTEPSLNSYFDTTHADTNSAYFNITQLKKHSTCSSKINLQEDSAAWSKFEWITSYGRLVKSMTQGSQLGAISENRYTEMDDYDWQDYMYDGPRYKTKSGSNRTVSICAMAKNEEAYLDEWWSYYKALGVSTLYLYENDNTPSLYQWVSMQDQLKDSSSLSSSAVPTVHYKHWPTTDRPQESAYQDCMKQSLADGHTWSANLDIDEFLMMYKHKHIVDFLEEYALNGSLVVHWHVFGTNNWESYSPQPLTKRFRMRGDFAQRIKTIALLKDVDMRRYPTCHVVHHTKGKKAFDTAGHDQTGKMGDKNNKPSDVAILYHYRTKSFKEYIAKRLRGRASMGGNISEYLLRKAEERKIDVGSDVYDDRMWKKMKEYVPKYALYDILYPEKEDIKLNQ